MKKQLKELLVKIHKQPMKKQKKLITEAFIEWKGSEDQVDDILVIGIKI